MALNSRDKALRIERRTEAFAAPPSCCLWPCRGVVCAPISPAQVWLPSMEVHSSAECVRWDGGGCGFVVCVRIFFQFGKGLSNIFFAQIPFKQFLRCWIQVLLKSVRFFLCLLVQKCLCVRHVYIPLLDFSSGLTFIITDISNINGIFKSKKGKNLLFYKEKPPSSSRPRP